MYWVSLMCLSTVSGLHCGFCFSWEGFSHSLDSSSSVVLTCALMEGKVDPMQTSRLAQLEMRYQVHYYLFHSLVV